MAWLVWLAGVAGPVSAQGSALEGQRLFNGAASLSGQIRGHTDPLPAASLRCANCHARSAPGAGVAARPGLGGTERFGPVLDAAWLTQARERRGGPASAYTAQRLCTALREGLDPNRVYMARSMPLYRVSDADCAHLWAYLSGLDEPAAR